MANFMVFSKNSTISGRISRSQDPTTIISNGGPFTDITKQNLWWNLIFLLIKNLNFGSYMTQWSQSTKTRAQKRNTNDYNDVMMYFGHI